MWSKFIFCLLIGILSTGYKFSFAQGKKKTQAVQMPQLDSVDIANYQFEFPNVNQVPFYYDKNRYQQIIKLEQEKNWEKLFPVLKKYVAHFGIQNFYKNTYWLWRLAKLTELYGNLDEAISLYKLVLKHHRNDIDLSKIMIFFDSINYENKDTYVPLDYYYELVEYRKAVDTLRPPRGVLLNMGEAVNSKYSDYGPTLSINDDIILFTSKRHKIRNGVETLDNEDLFLSRREGENFWNDALALKGINSEFNEGSACISKNGKTIFFSRCNSPDSYGSCDLFEAKLSEDSTWIIKNLGIEVNSRSWESHPSLSHTEDTLYFASDRIGGFGLADIYFTSKDKNGNWKPAQNAGPVVNTRQNEVSPFYHPLHDILYFSSNGHLLNFGEFDIYKAYRHRRGWGEPVNIGPLVNGENSEFYFTIDSKSWYLFYAKAMENNMGNLDLYSFPLPMEAQPGATTQISGSLTDSQGKPFKKGIVSIIDLDSGIEVAPKFLKEDGSFEFSLINNKNYLLIIQGEEFFRIEEIFFLDGPMQFHRISEPISSKIKFESIEFDNAKAELKSEMYYDLDKLANFMLDNPDFKLKISGHTDSDGSETFNLKLSQERAEEIQEYLVQLGNIPAARIEAKGFGSSKPIVEETTEENKRLNRRVEFEIYRPAKSELDQMIREEQEELDDDGWGVQNP